LFCLLFPLVVCLAQVAGAAAEEDGRQQDGRYACSFDERCLGNASVALLPWLRPWEPVKRSQPVCSPAAGGTGKSVALLRLVCWIAFFCFLRSQFRGRLAARFLLQQTPDTSSSEVSFAQEEVGLLGVKRLPLTGSVITSHRLPLRFVRCFSFIARGKHRGVGFA